MKQTSHYLKSIFAAASLILFGCATAWSQTFVWDGRKVNPLSYEVPRAVLTNDAMVERTVVSNTSEQLVMAWDFNRKRKFLVGSNDFVLIDAAYPSARRASAVIVKEFCGGSICRDFDAALVVPEKDFVKVYRAGTAQKITVTLVNGEVAQAKAERIWTGRDKFGTDTFEARELVKGAGFISSGVKHQWLKLIDAHPEAFFKDEFLRKRLASIVSLEQFRDLRQTMGVAGGGALLNGRLVLLTGCMPHNCGGNYGAVLIDAVTDDLWWTQYSDSGLSVSGGTSHLTEADGRKNMVLSALRSQTGSTDEVELTLNEAGNLAYKKLPGKR